MGKIKSINISTEKGVKKKSVESAEFVVKHGIKGDAHAGDWHRQVSFLAQESVNKMTDSGGIEIGPGDFAENITTEDVEIAGRRVGERLLVNDTVFLITQIGKKCHFHCEIYHTVGDCVMPREGIFATVQNEGSAKIGDKVEVLEKNGLTVAVVTLSDKGSRGEREDLTGPAVCKLAEDYLSPVLVRTEMIPDDKLQLETMLKHMADIQKFDVIITNGSTGVAPRDIAPDVTLNVIERRLPGFEEAMRMESFKRVISAVTSRAVCGTRGDSLIINLPGSPKGAVENLEVIIEAIPHTVKKLQGDPEDCAK